MASSSEVPPWKYHVFLSFRGEDTRKGFTDHLYAAFQRKGMIAFRDDEQLHRGEVISNELRQAIQQSLSAVVVLSSNYASSTWCLDELQNIMESKAVLHREVFPVFYGVDPSDVRNQRGNFAESFKNFEEKFSGDNKKVKRWKDILKDIANLSGWDSKDRHEAELIEDIVAKVWIKLQPKLPTHVDNLVGIDSTIKEIASLLSRGTEDVSYIGIWGMGGIGKTTLARVIYDINYQQFEISCFLANVREISQKSDGLVELQRKLLSCLKINNLEIDDLHDGMNTIKMLLCNKKVLLVLDDITSLSQLDCLAANQGWFGSGSRIIVTTRDKHLLISHGVCEEYEMKALNATDSFTLFNQKAFKTDQPPEGYLDLSKQMVQYAGGLPLGLEVLGSFLCGRRLCEWEEALHDIKQVDQNDIFKSLRISYDGLEDTKKALFLDIAFFFTGWDKDQVTQVLKDCGLCPTIGINVLIEKSLVTCVKGTLEMHDLLQEMGKKIVYQESPNEASKRSRLYSLEDVNHVLKQNKEAEFVQGIILKLSEACEVHWDPEAFSKMRNLRILMILGELHLPLGLNCLSSSLKVLEWKGYPFQHLPLGLSLDELIHLKMHSSKIVQLWRGTQYFKNLKSIDLRDSKDLIRSPNISLVPNLERLVLQGCKNLHKVHKSVSEHNKLAILNLAGCINLKILPRKFEINALKELILSDCPKLKKLPEFGVSMKCLAKLDLRNCEILVCLPQSICNLESLKILNIQGCSKISWLPNNLNGNTGLEEHNISGTAIREVSSSPQRLKHLIKSSFSGYARLMNKARCLSLANGEVFDFREHALAKNLKFKLPCLSGFPMLKKLRLRYCSLSDASIPSDLGELASLEELHLSGNDFVNLPSSIGKLSRLRRLELYDCPKLQILPQLPPGIQWLFLQNCNQLDSAFIGPEMLYKILEQHGWNSAWNWTPFWLIIPGSKIPTWFNNQGLVDPRLKHLSCVKYDDQYDSIGSIIVDIPNSREPWGIVVCLALDSTNSVVPGKGNTKQCTTDVVWAAKDPDTEIAVCQLKFFGFRTHFSSHHLFIAMLKRDDPLFMPHLTGDKIKLQLVIYARDLYRLGKVKLRNCGWRVVCEEDVQVWRRQQKKAASGVVNQCRITEITDELDGVFP